MHLPAAQVESNRSALSGEMYQLVLNALKPYLAPDDLFQVAQALSDVIIYGSNSTSALVDILARRVPVLNHIGSQWLHIAVRSCYYSAGLPNSSGGEVLPLRRLAPWTCTHTVPA